MDARRLLTTLSLLALAPDAAARLSVVATVPDLAALARDVGGEHVDVVSLAGPDQDPHYVDPRPSYMVMLRKADLLLLVGLELEVGWLPNLVVGARNGAIQPGEPGHFDASRFVRKLGVPDRVDRAEGDIHPGGNPHYVFDPREMAKVALALGARLGALQPERAGHFRGRAEEVSRALETLARRERERFARLPSSSRRFVAYHESLPYIVDWLGLEQVATMEPKPGVRPAPGRVHTVMKTMEATGVRVILQESYYPARLSKTVAKLVSGGRVVKLAGGTDFEGGQTYDQRVTNLAERIHAALSP